MSQFDAPPLAVQDAVNPSEADESRISLLAARVGSSQALAEMLDGCRDYLLLVANAEVPNMVRPKVAASDLVQQSMADAWQAIGQFRGQSSYELRGWLRTILLNNLRDATRRYCGAEKRDATREMPLPESSRDQGVEAFTAADPTPSVAAVTNEESARLHAALARLPEHYAQIIRLHNLEYLSFAEIGLRVQLESDLARKLWERAVKRLAKELRQRP